MKKTENNKLWKLVIGKIHNGLNADEDAEFEKIKETEEVKEAIQQTVRIRFKVFGSFFIRKIDKEKNWKYINSQISHYPEILKLIVHFSRYAAVFLMALIIGVTIPRWLYKSHEVTYNKIELEWGQMSTVTLSDGTKVWLNAGTTFEYPTTFDTQKRSVILDGEAQFKVTHNTKVPFEVKTKSGIIKVYGTTFNVESYRDDKLFVVTLIEGKVSVEDNNGISLAILNPSEQISINKLTGETNLRKVNTAFFSSWIDGKILLEDTKLSDLAIILKRWYNVDIDFAGENTGNIRISGTIIKGKPLDLFLKVLERMYGIEYRLIVNADKKDKVIIGKNKLPMAD